MLDNPSHRHWTPPQFRVTDLPPEDEWRRLVAASPTATFFHSLEWSRIYARHHAGEPFFLLAESDGRLVGCQAAVRIRRSVFYAVESLPMGTYGGPIVDPSYRDAESLERELYERYQKMTRRPGCLRSHCVVRHPSALSSGEPFLPTPIHIVPLSGGFDSFWMDVFPKNRRNECRRATRNGVRVVLGSDPSHLDPYYAMHVEACRRWGLAPHPLEFFRDMIALGDENVLFFTALHGDRVLGAHLTFVSGRELLVWNGVTAREDSNRFFPASMLIMCEAEEACRRGLDVLNLGGGGHTPGLSEFKRLVGGCADTVYTHARTAAPFRLLHRTWHALRG